MIRIFLPAVLLILGFQCQNESPEPLPAYDFTEKLTLTPYKKIYEVDDTIWVQFKTTEKSLFDRLSNNHISTDTTYLGLSFYLERHYPVLNQVGFFSEATVENALEVSYTPLYTYYNVLNFRTGCDDNSYFFRAAFVPKEPGVFSIRPQVDFSPCPTKLSAPRAKFTFTFDLADCNKDVWLTVPPESRRGESGFTDLIIERKEMFVFKVE